MKWKILIKFLYLAALLAFAAVEGERESQLIDSDPSADQPVMYHASLEE